MSIFKRLGAAFKRYFLNPLRIEITLDMVEARSGTEEHPWDHPKGYPYQVYGRPQDNDFRPQAITTWTKETELEGYRLVEDIYSERLYFVPDQEDPSDA